MSEEADLPLWLLSPLAVVGAGLLLSQVIGVLMQARGWPKLYGAVIAGLILGRQRLRPGRRRPAQAISGAVQRRRRAGAV
jgi:Kef-type K+ transport system membrane component KefB